MKFCVAADAVLCCSRIGRGIADDTYQVQFRHSGATPELVDYFMATLRLSHVVVGPSHVACHSWDEWPDFDSL